MSEDVAANLLRLLNTDRLAEAREGWKDDPVALAALNEKVTPLILADESFSCGCSECGEWNGVSRRCDCGNRRVYWMWENGVWFPDVY